MSKLSLFALLTAGLASCLFTHSLSIEQLEAAPPKKLSSFDRRVREILKQMTLDEKIGQMT